jgi:hypothetical protein
MAEYKEKQLDRNSAKALMEALGATNAKMVKNKQKQPAAKKKSGGATKKAGAGK